MSRIQALHRAAKNYNWVPSLFFAALMILGPLIYKDYGISWDEPVERLTGIVNLNYIGEFFRIRWIQNDPVLSANSSLHLLQYSDRYFGPAFGIVSVFLERLFRINDEQQIYFFRHLLNFAIFAAGVHALYQLASRRFASWKMGLLAALMLVLSPRLFGESFYNSKDLIFLSVFCIGLNSLVALITMPTIGRAIAHGIITALVIDTRSIGIVLPALSIVYFFYGQIIARSSTRKSLIIFFVYGVTLFIFVTIFWPFLWTNPIGHFLETLGKFSKWGTTQVAVLYLGDLYQIQKASLPWHYVFVWIGVTTPVVYLVFWFVGIGLTGWQLIQSKLTVLKDANYLQDLLFISASLGPIVTIVLLHSVIYDGWRHLYFIYPAFLLISLKAIHRTLHSAILGTKIKQIFLAIFTLYLGSLGFWMITNHPNQNIFFNTLAGKNWKAQFDVDYWGLSTRQALEEIARIDNRAKILIYAGSVMSLSDSLKILAPEIRARFEVTTDLDTANYIISNYRNNLTDYSKSPYSNELVYELKSGNENIVSIFSNPNTPQEHPEIGDKNAIKLGKESANMSVLGLGWSSPEGDGVWSDGKSANITIPLPNNHIKQIGVLIKPYIPKSGDAQIIEICGQFRKCIKISLINPDPIWLKFDIPNSQTSKSLSIHFNFFTPSQPSATENSDDTRYLGIKIMEINFVNEARK